MMNGMCVDQYDEADDHIHAFLILFEYLANDESQQNKRN
jgi:hypothetical protein